MPCPTLSILALESSKLVKIKIGNLLKLLGVALLSRISFLLMISYCLLMLLRLVVGLAILDDFYSCSGQKINLSKSKVLFSPNVKPDVASRLCRILGVSSTQDIGKYLGFPLRSNGRNSRDFNFIVEKVQAKLTSWKSKLLSPAGRVVLIQSSFPHYLLTTCKILLFLVEFVMILIDLIGTFFGARLVRVRKCT